VQVKNKPCVVYTAMHLILWKQSHGCETLIIEGINYKFQYLCKIQLKPERSEHINQTRRVLLMEQTRGK
jgi:hypothetical protein